MKRIWATIRRVAAVSAILLGAQQAQAAGTTAGTSIVNEVTVNYSVSGTPAPPVTDQESFVVDRKITLTVAEVGGVARIVAGGQTDKFITFTLTNTSNAQLDFALTAGQMANGAAVLGAPVGQNDNFDGTNVRIFVETGGVAGFDATDTQVTHINSLAADASRTLYVVADIPGAQVNGDRAGITLLATAREDDNGTSVGSAITPTAGADTAGMDTVFGDADGPAVSGDTTRDGQHSDDGSFLVDVTTLGVTKTSALISDPFNNTTNPKAIPGATVEYCLVLVNTGNQTISNVSFSDVLPTQVTYVAGSLLTGVTIDGSNQCDLNTGTAEDDNATDADETDPNGASYTSGTGTIAGTIGTINGAAKTGVRFRVTIN